MDESLVPIIQDQVFNMLSDFNFYCHEKQQQNKQLNREAAENALRLQQVLWELMDQKLPRGDSSHSLSEDSTSQEDTIPSSNVSNLIFTSTSNASCHGEIIPATCCQNNSISNTDSEFRIIKSTKGRDKLSLDGFIYNLHRDSRDGKKQWRCQVKTCKGILHTTLSNVVQMLGESRTRDWKIRDFQLSRLGQEAC